MFRTTNIDVIEYKNQETAKSRDLMSALFAEKYSSPYNTIG